MKKIISILILSCLLLMVVVSVSISKNVNYFDYTKGKKGLVVTQKNVFNQIKGYTKPNQKLGLIVNGKVRAKMLSDNNGVYLFKNIGLKVGLNKIVIKNLTKNQVDHKVEVYVDLEDPVLGAVVYNRRVYKNDYLSIKVMTSEKLSGLAGRVSETGETFMFTPVEDDPSRWTGKWKISKKLKAKKRYRVNIVGTDLAGNIGRVISDDFEINPRYALLAPKDNTITSKEKILVKGRADRDSKVVVNGINVIVDESNTFRVKIPLKFGKNLIVVTTDAPGIKKELATQKIRVLRQTTFVDLIDIKRKEYRDVVTNLATLGIIPENPDEAFRPEDPATRGELCTWLIRALDLQTPRLKKNIASDVPTLYWRAPYIKLAITKGFFNKFDDGSFKPNFGVTEEEGERLFVLLDKLSGAEKEKISWLKDKANKLFMSLRDSFEMVAYAGKKKKKYLSRIEAAKKLSKTKTIKKKRKNLMDWGKGFTAKKIFKTGSAPGIRYVTTQPKVVRADGKTIVLIQAKIYDPKGLYNIRAVRGDLTAIGNISDYSLVDNGKWGDKRAGDSIYSLQTTVSKRIKPGKKTLTITAANKSGWAAASKAALAVAKKK